MIEGILSYIWPDNPIEKVLGFALLVLLVMGLAGPLEAEARIAINLFYWVIPILTTALFWLLVSLKQYTKAFKVDELLSPLLFYGIIFSIIYYGLGEADSIILGFIPLSGRFALGSALLLCTGASHFLQIRYLGLDEVESQERSKRSIIPQHETLSYFAQTIGEWGIMFLSIIFIIMIVVQAWPHVGDVRTTFPIALLFLIILSPCLLSVHRTETLFWLLFILFSVSILCGIRLNIHGLAFLGYEIFLFILFGIALIYRLETTYHHVVLVSILLLFMLIGMVLEAVEIFGPGVLKSALTAVVVPLLAAVVSAFLAAKWSRIQSSPPEAFVTTEEASQQLGLSRSAVYKLLRNGTIRGNKAGRNWVITRKALDGYKATRSDKEPNQY